MNLEIIKNKLYSMFRGGFFHILTGNFLNKAIAMISSIVVARLIDKTEYAYLCYADNIYSYISLLSGLGLSTAILKYCATDKKYNKAYLSFSLKFGGAFELIASLALCIIVSFVNIPYPKARLYMWALCLYPALSYFFSVIACYLRTQFKNKEYATTALIQSAVVCVSSIPLIITIGSAGIVVARYIGVVLVIFIVGKIIYKSLATSETQKLTKDEKKAFLAMGLSLMIANLFSSIMPINESFLVNNIIKNETITANFKVAGMFPQMLLLVAGAVTVYYFPIIAQMKDWNEIRSKVYKIGVFNFFFVLAVAIVGALLTPLAIRIFYGEKYVDAISITYLLWVMRAMNGCIRMVPINMLPAIGKTKFNMYVAIGSCILQTTIDYFLISWIGINGAAIGAIIVYAISGVMYWGYFSYVCRKEIAKCTMQQ